MNIRDRILNKVASFLDARGRHRTILDRDGETPYLERYYILFKDRSWFPFNLVMHNILRSDLDDLHDHPWCYATLILKGGYWETTPKGRFWRPAGWFTFRRATSLHRLEIDPGVDCWTLFFMGRRKREWGFMRRGKWVQWETYLADRERHPLIITEKQKESAYEG